MTKTLFANALFIGFLFTISLLSSCITDKDIIPGGGNDEKTVSIRFQQPDRTRSTLSPMGNVQAAFNTGNLYLVTAGGVIIEHYPIVPGLAGGNVVSAGDNIGRDHLDAPGGVTIPSVPASVTEVVIVGNTSGNPPSGTVHTAVGARLIDVISQHNATTPGVNLFGRNTLTHTTGDVSITTGNLIYRTQVRMVPTVARFEVADITGLGDIESFVVEGLFIDKFFPQAQVNGVIPSTVAKITRDPDDNAGVDADPADFVGTIAPYLADTNHAIHDWGNWTSSTLVASPAGNNIWSYHVFAHNNNSTAAPAIIIRLRDVVVNGATKPNPQFITVIGFNRTDAVGGVLGTIRQGDVYHIPTGRLRFTENDLSPIPYVKPINVDIEVYVIPWNDVIVTPGTPFRQENPENTIINLGARHIFDLEEARGGTWKFTYLWQMRGADGVWTNIGDWSTDPHLMTMPLTEDTRFLT